MLRARISRLAVLASLALFLMTSPAWSLRIRMAPVAERVAVADAVVVGKVTEIEKKIVSAKPGFGAEEKVEFQVAVIEIKDAPLGAKGLTHLRVAFIPPQQGGPVRPGGRFPGNTLAKGQEGCFFLMQHFEENFYVLRMDLQTIDGKSDTFKKEVAEVSRIAKLLADPTAGLKSKNAAERTTVAGLLLARYRTPKDGQTKEEPLDAEESKRILQTLAEADFSKQSSPTDIVPQQSFFRLGLTEQDGWMPEPFKNFQVEFPAAAKKWLQENADKYRIKKFVAEKKEKE